MRKNMVKEKNEAFLIEILQNIINESTQFFV